MKSTTLKRSNLTKEKIAMLEAIDRYSKEHGSEDFYRIQNKSKELDALWQTFGIRQKNEKAPQVYFVAGLIVGVILTLVLTTVIGLLINVSTPKDDSITPAQQVTEPAKFSFIPADTKDAKTALPTTLKEEKYTVKEGDTLESIVIRFYGSFDMQKVNLIQEANKMANPNALSIGQELIIPLKK